MCDAVHALLLEDLDRFSIAEITAGVDVSVVEARRRDFTDRLNAPLPLFRPAADDEDEDVLRGALGLPPRRR